MPITNALKSRLNVETDLNRVVTPMLDMTFQLLFYFVINFHAPHGEGQVDLNLSGEEKGIPIFPLDPQNQPDEFVISAFSPSGSLDLLTFRFNQFEPETLSNEDLLGALKTKLRTIPKPTNQHKPLLKIECAKKLKYSEMIRIVNLCREEGFHEIGITPLR